MSGTIVVFLMLILVSTPFGFVTGHGPILGGNFYDIFGVRLEYTRMLKMYWVQVKLNSYRTI